jgi:hypothetical protein
VADQIKIRIGLDGAEDVQRKLDGVRDTGKKAGDEISKSLNTARDVGNTSEAAKSQTSDRNSKPHSESVPTPRRLADKINSEENSERSREAVESLREALHVLHPALAEADIGFGELGGILRAAGGGVVAFGLAIAGTLVAALEKAGDSANDASARLGAFTGSRESGRGAFDQLKGTAEQLRVPTGDLTAPFEQLLRANQSSPAGTQASDKRLQDTLATFVKGAQADRTADFDKAIAGITEFFSNLKDNGAISPESVKGLAENVSPTLAKQIVDDLSSRLPGKQTYTTQDVIQSTANVRPQVDQNLLKTQADAVDSITTAWVHFRASIDQLEEAIGGGSPVSSVLNEVSEEIGAIAPILKKIREYAKDAAGRGAEIGAKLPIPGGAVLGGAIGAGTGVAVNATKATFEKAIGLVRGEAERRQEGASDESLSTSDILQKAKDYYFPRSEAAPTSPIEATPTAQNPGAAAPAAQPVATASDGGIASVDTLGEASEKAAKQVEEHGNAAEGAQKSLNEFAEGANKLEIIASELSKQQAAIDLKFQPAEAASSLAKDQISVQNADIHQKQAAIGVEEAHKGVELAALAPAAAHNSVANASNALEAARIASLKLRGVDTTSREELLQRDQSDQAEKDAELALKRAKIDEKYSYLDAPKARLSAEKAETDIRSAEIEKSDTSLKLAKDKQGAPISHELAQLRYAQASLDELKLTSKYGEKTVEKLQEILNALTKTKSTGQRDNDRSEKSDGDRDRSDARGARQGAQNGVGQVPGSGQDATPGASEFNAHDYERNAKRTGLRTVEGDQLAREQAHAQGKRYGTEHTVESDRLAREKQTAPATSDTSSAPAASSLPKVLSVPKVSSTPEESTRPGFERAGPGQPEWPIREQNGEAKNRYEIGKEWLDHHEFSAADGQIHRDFTNHIRDQLGVPHETEQHGVAPHPKGGAADLSERMQIPFYEDEPEQPRRYRYVKDGYQPPTLGKYDKDMNFVPAPNKDQPYPRLRDHSLSGRPYSPLEDTYDTKGDGNKYVPGGGSFPPIYDYGQSQPLSFPKYNKEQYDSLPEPLPRPRPPEAPPRPPEPLPPPPQSQTEQPAGQQFAGLGNVIEQLVNKISGSINNLNPKDTNVPNPEAIGIRGDKGDDQAPQEATNHIAALGEAAEQASQKLLSINPTSSSSEGETPAPAAADVTTAASGGYISGPGTTTSDSIPALLSNREFVHNAKAVEHYGVPFMHAVNSRTLKFAAGGLADSDKLREVKGIVDDGSSDTSSHKSKDPFVGDYGEGRAFGDTGNTPGFAAGGLVGHFAGGGSVGSSSAIANFRETVRGFANGGIVEVPHLAIGGMPDISSPTLSKSALDAAGSKSNGLDLSHYGTVDLRHDGGDHRVITQDVTMRNLQSAANHAKRFSTGRQPSWYGGRG